VTTYVALLDGGRREEPLEVRRTGPGTYEVRLRGEVHAVDAFRHDHGTLSLLVDTESYTATLDERAGGAGRGPVVHVRVRGSVFPMELLGERKLRMRKAVGELTVGGRQEVTAPLPGRVVRVLVRTGERVSAGQPLVVVEALRMENELRSPKDGRVIEVHVSDGQVVEANAKLCAVE
jgi:biotin carboxyl carrier protein